ncbi:MAG: transporter [Phycisphaerae bacterium]|nr:transporter [Phycisphaerae bacterium]
MSTCSHIAIIAGTSAVLLLGSAGTYAEGPSDLTLSLSYASLAQADEPAGQQAIEDDEVPRPAAGDASSTDLAKKLQNPVADLISFPIQSNLDFGGGIDLPSTGRSRFFNRVLPRGPARLATRVLNFALGEEPDRDQAFKYLLNIQPVIPITLNDDWNVISRTILPVVYQDNVLGVSSQGGMGDILQSLFFSPKSTEPFIWGVGPVFLFPTATDDSLGADRWGMGPTGVILKQSGPWTYGMLANHIWSFARDDNRKEINATYLQPFLSYTFKTATTLSFSTESTYDWVGNQWTVPLVGGVSQLVKIGKLPVSLGVNGKYWVEGPDSAPDWGIRFTMTFLFPK